MTGSNGQPATVYFRQTFNVADPSFYYSLNLNLVQDDGVVVYLNGQEIARLNLPQPPTPITPATPALTAMTGAAARAYRSINDSNALTLLKPGANVLAVEVHPGGSNQVDLTFDLELAANVPPYPYQPPTVFITLPAYDSLHRFGTKVPISADVLDPDGSVTQVVFYVRAHSFDAVQQLIGVDNTTPYSAIASNLPAGHYHAYASATDNRGVISYALPVDFMIHQPPGTPDLRIRLQKAAGVEFVTLEWDDEMALLEHASTLPDNWMPIAGAGSPYPVPTGMKADFYRLRLQGTGQMLH